MTINDHGPGTNSEYDANTNKGKSHSGDGHTAPNSSQEAIAIIGMACRFAGGATSPEKLWNLVSEGRDAWSTIPKNRFNQDAFYHPHPDHLSTMTTKGGYFLEEDPALFDTSFFNLTTEMAAAMDPQVRLQLEIVFEAFESAGLPLSSVMGTKTSVFTGSFSQDYYDIQIRDPLSLPRGLVTGNYAAMLANRVSHFFDLKGPSVAIDTGCSTSLMGLHLAAQSLRQGDSDCAIVGGTCLNLNPLASVGLSTIQTTGSDGKCYAFDDRAQGYGRGEGIAAVILKPLSAAIRDGNVIRAVLRETACNQDGHTSVITTPSSDAQLELIKACYARARLNPLDTTVVETHGTGTRVGDPAEAKAIGNAIGLGRKRPVFIGSVKTNVGHTEAVSGLASVIKMVMALEHRQIPPSLNFEKPNPDIDFQALCLQLPNRLEAWRSEGPRRASINNFGYGGTNTHVILEEAPPPSLNPVSGIRRPSHQLFLLSARHEGAMQQMASNLKQYLQSSEEKFSNQTEFANLAYTLTECRTRFPWSLAVSASGPSGLIKALESNNTQITEALHKPMRLGFVFNGQGAQSFDMGRELSAAYPVYRETLKQCDDIIKSFGADWSLITELERNEETSRINEVRFSMPATCALQLALVHLLTDLGIKPVAVTGHSTGEAAAAFTSGALSLHDAMAVSYFRGLISHDHLSTGSKVVPGGMLAVGLSSSDAKHCIEEFASGKVVVACENSPSSVTLSGDMDAIDKLAAVFSSTGVFARKLVVQTAFHSHHMLPMQDGYLSALQKHLNNLAEYEEKVSFFSSVTGSQIQRGYSFGPDYWVQNMTHPVLFHDSFRTMVERQCSDGKHLQAIDAIVEVGPHSVLAGPIRQCLKSSSLNESAVAYASCLERGQNAVITIQRLAGFLVTKGHRVNTAYLNSPNGQHGLRVVTGLPSYVWNHSQRFWQESRSSQELRFREDAHHDLLGARLTGASDRAPIWRYMVRTSELPWIRDHTVQGNIVFPGAGYITMAIEAMRQLHKSKTSIKGYILKEVDILRATIIPENTDGIELQLFLEPASQKSLEPDTRSFHIYTPLSDGTWAETARGYIAVSNKHALLDSPLRSSDYIGTTDMYHEATMPSEFYERLSSMEIKHGKSFQAITGIRSGDNSSRSTIMVPNSALQMPQHWQQSHIVHPITLDCVFQAAYPALSNQALHMVGAAVPRHIDTLFISTEISPQPGSQLEAFSRVLNHNSQGFDASLVVTASGSSNDAVVQIGGMHFQSVGSVTSNGADNQREMHAFEDWVPSVHLNNVNELFGPHLQRAADPCELSLGQDLTQAVYHLIADTMAGLKLEEIPHLAWYHKSFYHWMELELQLASEDKLAPNSSTWTRVTPNAKAALFKRVTESGTHGKMTMRIGNNLTAILRGEVEPLEVMLEGGLLYQFYQQMLHFPQSVQQVAQIAKAIALENPKIRILEIGAGTGGCTRPVLSALGGERDIPATLEHYVFTDISSGFFQAARDRFADLGDLISYQTLDIENDPAEQGFNDKYDLIIAAQVLHATKQLSRTLNNVRSLLKDNGKLLMVETTRDTADVSLIFGTLPGWWLSEEPERKDSPNMSSEQWAPFLKEAGFTGVDMDLRDCENEEYMAMSVIMSTALPKPSPVYEKEVALVYKSSQLAFGWLESLAGKIKDLTGSEPEVVALGEADIKDKNCIFFSGFDGNTETFNDFDFDFDLIKELAIRSGGLLWVTTGSAKDCDIPIHALHKGFLRTCRMEYRNKIFGSLDLDPSHDLDNVSQAIIVKVFAKLFNSAGATSEDYEYAERRGQVLLPRIQPDIVEDNRIINNGTQTEMQPFIQNINDGRVLKLEVAKTGSLDNLVFCDNKDVLLPLPVDWVEIEPRAYGINFRDVMGAMGQLDGRPNFGFESAGVITRVGPTGSHKLQPGMRVIAFTPHGHLSTRTRVPWHNVVTIPDDMEFFEAASVVMVFATAYYSMFNIARLEEGETMLVHAAAGGVGQACIILAKWKGIKVLATVGSNEKREFLVETYGLLNEQIFSSRDDSFVLGVLEATKQQGVDVVINSLSGPLLNASWNIIAQHGRFIEIGVKDIQSNKALDMRPFKKAAVFSAIDLIQLSDTRGHVIQELLVTIMGLIKTKAIRNISPIMTYRVSDIPRAFRTMQTGKHIGKIVIVPEDGDIVKTLPCSEAANLSSNSSYLIIGGLGGIGRWSARWMVDHGAKHLILLSRNASKSPQAASLKEELTNLGAQVILQDCDASDVATLQTMLVECSETMPPVRGIIHGGMVLNSALLEDMTSTQWAETLYVKVKATQNLHELFPNPTDLDFFIILSSISSVLGQASDANYAAGGAFQDALARHRAANGLPCVSIGLGAVESVGYVAEKDSKFLDRLVALGYRKLSAANISQLLDYCVRYPLRTPRTAHIIAGIESTAIQKQAWRKELRFAALSDQNRLGDESAGAASSDKRRSELKHQLEKSENVEEVGKVLEKALVEKLSDMFVIPEGNIDVGKSLPQYGVDSLVAVELKNWLTPMTGCETSTFELLAGTSMKELAATIAQKRAHQNRSG